MRLDLLAGVLWAHCHIKVLPSALADISIDQQRRLAAALRLDYDNDSKQDYWPDLVSRKLCFALPQPMDALGPAPLFTTTVGPGQARPVSSRDHHATRHA